MRMAGIDEVSAFVEQNKIRTNPRGIETVVEEQIRQFGSDGLTMIKPSGLNIRTRLGKRGW